MTSTAAPREVPLWLIFMPGTMLLLAPGCASERQEGVVTRSGAVGDSCDAYAQCTEGLGCLDDLGPGYCTRQCSPQAPCPEDGSARCVWLTNGDAYCLRQCAGQAECATDTSCTPLRQGGFSVCFP